MHAGRFIVATLLCSAVLHAQDHPDAIGNGMHPYPLWPSKPVAGWPGVAVDDKTTFEKLKGLGMGLATYGQPEFLAYPGAVHHVRHVYQRRITPYPLYNHHTLVKNFVLHQMPAHAARCVNFAEPVYYTPSTAPRVRTSKSRPTVKALPWKKGDPVIRLDLGALPRGVYTLRPIVAAPTATKTEPPTLVQFRLRVNDDPANKTARRDYTLHARVLDNFYAVQEFMFRSNGDGRRMIAELQRLDLGPVLRLYNIDLHDHLAQMPKRRLKTRTTFDGLLPTDSKAREALWAKNRQAEPEAWGALQKPAHTAAEQRELDDAVWQYSLPPPNTHLVGNGYYLQRAKPLPLRFTRVGSGWEMAVKQGSPLFVHAPRGELFVETGKPFGRVFSEKPRDIATQPVKVQPGWQLDADAAASLYAANIPITSNAGLNPRAKPVLEPWVKFGHPPSARAAALRLVRYAWHAPLINPKHALAYVTGFEGLERGLIFHRGMQPTLDSLRCYDLLYNFISTDAELARIVGRHLPWVKTPDDVVTLIDTYLVQDFANRLLHYRQYSDTQVDDALFLVQLANHHPATRPWMKFIFTNSRQYPLSQGGVTDQFVTDYTRDGGVDRGSFAMGLASPAGATAALAESFGTYLKSGGDTAFDINSRNHHPARWQLPYFLLEGSVAGRINPGVGSGGGPAEPYGKFTNTPEARDLVAFGWQLHRDPRFAHELIHQFGRAKETDNEWHAITQAAVRQPRDAYLANRSRVLSQWSGYLEDGPAQDDFRFRRAAAVRVSAAYGYFAHRDTLDLRVFAFGLTMSGDFNQQQGYGWPPQRTTRLHNVVEVDGQNWRGHAWVRGLLDAPGAQYLSAEAPAPHDRPQVKFFRRQVAMVEIHPGQTSAKPKPLQDAGVTLPAGYLVDVFRISGGKQHVYNFHGCVDDQFTVNIANLRSPAVPSEVEYLSPYRPANVPQDLKLAPPGGFPLKTPPDYWAGTVTSEHLTATWRLRREAEQQMLGEHAAMTSSRKFIRLQLLNQKGSRVLHGIARGKDGNGYYGRCLHMLREADESVFTAVIEPFAGTSSITGIRPLVIANNETDARRATAIEVQTRHGRRDVVFADGRSERVRQLPKMKIAAEYALVSRDAKGLQHAVLHAGTLLDCDELKIEPERMAYTAVIESADYDKRTFVVTGQLPAHLAGQFFEAGNNDHRTSVEIAKLAPLGRNSKVTTRKSLELMRVHCSDLSGSAGTMRGNIAKLRLRGRDVGLTATNADGSKTWRAGYVDTQGIEFKLESIGDSSGPIFHNADIPGGYLRIWDAGLGDQLTLRTSVALRRMPGKERVYQVTATTPFKLELQGEHARWKKGAGEWRDLPVKKAGNRLALEIGAQLLGRTSRLFLWVE